MILCVSKFSVFLGGFWLSGMEKCWFSMVLRRLGCCVSFVVIFGVVVMMLIRLFVSFGLFINRESG